MLPKNLSYQTNIEASSAKSYKTNIQPQNGTGNYNPGDTITINIPTRNNLVMACSENYLKFNAVVTQGGADGSVRLDSCGAHGYIQRIRVFHGSNLLSDIDNYGALAKIMFDTQAPADASYGKYNVMAGTRSDLVVNATKLTAVQVNSGARLSGATGYGTAQLVTATSNTNTYCLNLVSLVGTLCSQKYIPLFAMTSAPLRVEITLVSNGLNAVCAETALGAIPFHLTNVEYVANLIELSDTAVETIRQSLNGQPLQFVVPDYRNFSWTTTTAGGANTTVSMPIAAKYSSLKALFIVLRNTATTGIITQFPYNFCKFGLSDYTFRIGPQVVPSKAPNTVQEMFSELLKAVGSMSDLNHQPSIDLDSYQLDLPVANNDTAGVNGNINSGSFVVGLDLENYSNADKSNLFAGYNSNTDDIYFVANHLTAGATTIRYDAFANFDSVLVFENGTCYVKF